MGGDDFLQRLEQTASEVGLETASWPPLIPIPPLCEIESSAKPFPVSALGPVAGPATAAIARKVAAPEAIAAGSVLSAISVSAQSLVDVVLPHGSVAPISLFIITAAESGDRKSATDAIVELPLKEYRQRQYRDYAAASSEFESRRRHRGSTDTAAPPVVKALTVSKGTVEGLTKQLRHQSHIGLFSPDGGDFLAGHSLSAERRQSGIAWCVRAWSGESLDNLTAGDGLSVVCNRRVSMHLLVQPVVLQGFIKDPLAQGQGMTARCLIAAPSTLAGTRMFRLSSANEEQSIQNFHRHIRVLLSKPLPYCSNGDGLELEPTQVRLNPEATNLWIEFHDRIEVQMGPGLQLATVRPWASKAAEHAARIATCLAILENPWVVELSAEHMRGGIEIASFYLDEHRRLTGLSETNQRVTCLQALVDWLRRRGGVVSSAEILQYSPRQIRDLKAAGIEPLMQELVQRGYVRRGVDGWQVR